MKIENNKLSNLKEVKTIHLPKSVYIPFYLQDGRIAFMCSKGEIIIANYLQKNNISFISQKRFDSLKRMPYDFYIPQNNLLIEYQGQQHFFPVQNFGGEKSFIRQQEIDKIKKDFAILNGYDFLEISYKDFQNIESILAQRLSLLESKI